MKVFHAVMEEGSVSKAAERLNLTQPAVSIALSGLEERIGFSLFYRSKGHFSPKPEAYLLHNDAEMSIMAVEQFANRAKSIRDGGEGFIRVGSIGAGAFGFIPEIMAEFRQSHKSVDVHLDIRNPASLVQFVGNGQIDIGVTEAPVAAPTLDVLPLNIPCVCIMAENDPLTRLKSICPQDLDGQEIIGITKDNQHDRRLKSVFAESGVNYSPSVYGFFFAVVRRLVANGLGVAICDVANAKKNLCDGVVWRPFDPAISFEMAIISKKGTEMSKSATVFRDMLLDWQTYV